MTVQSELVHELPISSREHMAAVARARRFAGAAPALRRLVGVLAPRALPAPLLAPWALARAFARVAHVALHFRGCSCSPRPTRSRSSCTTWRAPQLLLGDLALASVFSARTSPAEGAASGAARLDDLCAAAPPARRRRSREPVRPLGRLKDKLHALDREAVLAERMRRLFGTWRPEIHSERATGCRGTTGRESHCIHETARSTRRSACTGLYAGGYSRRRLPLGGLPWSAGICIARAGDARLEQLPGARLVAAAALLQATGNRLLRLRRA